jgi:hypothetical protein
VRQKITPAGEKLKRRRYRQLPSYLRQSSDRRLA